jgi:aminotransferase
MGRHELSAVRDVFQTQWLGNGPKTAEFCARFAALIGVPSSQVADVSCCTEGLFQIIDAIGLGPADEVVLPTVSFIGAAHAVRASGASVSLCDVDPRTLNPSCAHIEAAITPRTRAIVVLHFGGHPGEIAAIAEMSHRRGLFLIEDAACAIGATSGGRACGTFGDAAAWSFDAMKIVVTGDGGIVRVRDPEILRRICKQVFLGIDRSGFAKAQAGTRWWEEDPDCIGRRARMNDISAAIGIVQLTRLKPFLRRRQAIARRYDRAFADLAWLERPPWPGGDVATSWYFYWIQLDPADRDALASHLLTKGIYATFRYWPLHKMHLYRSSDAFPGADSAAARTLLLPIHQGLSNAEIQSVIAAVRDFGAIRSNAGGRVQ